jgi:general secretion pathway protein A
MFLKYFGLREQPFGVTPDPRFLYLSAPHREALASLFYGIEAGRGFLALIAQPGMGKTTLLFHLLEKFRSSARTAFLFQTQCNSREFMRFLLAELGYEGDTQDFVRMHEEFNKRLLQEARAGNRFIVVIDEAQNLEPSVLETVRLLSDFETPRAKLMQIILAGQPELAHKLASPGLSQLRQRVSLLNRLEPLSSWELKNYIEHRLRIAGYSGDPLFTDDAIALIGQVSEGIPRNINNLCFNGLTLACALRQKVVDLAAMQEVQADLDISRHTEMFMPPVTAVAPAAPAAMPAPNQSAPAAVPPAAPAPFVPTVQTSVVSPPAEPAVIEPAAPLRIEAPPAAATPPVEKQENLTPEEAKAYMEQFTRKLKGLQHSLDQNSHSRRPHRRREM